MKFQSNILVMLEIANSLVPYLQFTLDCPSQHTSGWMPLLDLEVRVATDNNSIDFRFYSKPCSSKYVMLQNSAMPARTKMSTLTQEVIRRLRNTRSTLPWDDYHAPILTELCRKMQRSGYSQEYRGEVVRAGVAGYERQVEASRRGTKPLYRPREWKKEERRKAKMLKKVAWYRPANCVTFYPATPRGELAKGINQILEEEGGRIGLALRAKEKGGVSLASRLVRADLKAGEPCGRPGCVLDRTSGGDGGPHNVPSVLYRGVCNLCGDTEEVGEYTGESGRSGFHRLKRHEKDVEKKDDRNAFAKHLALFHPEHQGDITNFNIKVVSTFKSACVRQKTEAVKIDSSTADHVLNSKAEHRQPALHRVVRMREQEEMQPPAQSARGRGVGGGRGGGVRGRRRRGE